MRTQKEINEYYDITKETYKIGQKVLKAMAASDLTMKILPKCLIGEYAYAIAEGFAREHLERMKGEIFDLGYEELCQDGRDQERSILGALLLNNDNIPIAKKNLNPDNFNSPVYRQIYAAILAVYGRDCRAVDLVNLSKYLLDQKLFDKIGGSQTLTSLFDDVGAVKDIETNIGLLKSSEKVKKLKP